MLGEVALELAKVLDAAMGLLEDGDVVRLEEALQTHSLVKAFLHIL